MPVKEIKKKKSGPNLEALVKEAMHEKKGEEIVTIDFSGIKNSIFKQFIICHGNSKVHVESIADFIEKHVREKSGEKPWHREGFTNSEWILLDYVDVVVHIFIESSRSFYQLEKLWADAEITRVLPEPTKKEIKNVRK